MMHGGEKFLMSRGRWASSVALILIVLLMTAFVAACGDDEATPTPTDATSPSPTAAATSTPSPVPPTPTPEPTATATPIPTPTPTATPTVAERSQTIISRFSWYDSDEIDDDSRSMTIQALNSMAENHYGLFRAVTREPWLDPDDIATEFEYVPGILTDLNRIAAVDDTITLRILIMPFLSDAGLGAQEKVTALAAIAERGRGHLAAVIDHPDYPGGITADVAVIDLFINYLKASDPNLESRLSALYWVGDDQDVSTEWMVGFTADYPAVVTALLDSSRNRPISTTILTHAMDMALIDPTLAAKFASLPTMVIAEFPGSDAWELMLTAAATDLDALREIVNAYLDENDALSEDDLGNIVRDSLSILNPDIHMTISDFDWVRDGIQPTIIATVDGDRPGMELGDDSDEDHIIILIGREATPESTETLNRLVEQEWMMDKLTPDERVVIIDFLHDLPNLPVSLFGMQFLLEDIKVEDITALQLMGNLPTGENFSFETVLTLILTHKRIEGEITDLNRRYLQTAIDEIRDRIREDESS